MLEHRWAQLCAVATFALLVVGGTVNPTGSSLACPEPTFLCHGQLFPPMTGGVFYEHGHRLLAEFIGLLQLVLTVLLLRRRPELKRLAWITLAMVAVQATLGALTVYYKLPWYISTGHLLLGMTYFATLVHVALRTRRAPTLVDLDTHRARVAELGTARRWIALACGAVMIQLLLGALVRHLGAALVCLGMPTCTIGGDWWPDTFVQHLHMVHRGFGVVVAVTTIAASIAVLRRCRSWTALRVMMFAAPVLVLGQVALGIVTVMTMRSVPVAVGHFAGAAALWGLWAGAWLITSDRRARRARATSDAPAPAGVGVPA
jgi:heme A synthase